MTDSAPFVVILSVALTPVSLTSATTGAAATESSVNVTPAEAVDTLPALSTCRTKTVFAPCDGL